MKAPVAKKERKVLKKHSDVRYDDYFWMNQRDTPEVIAYLEAENAYYQQQMAHTKALEEELFCEMKARIKEDDSSVPYFYNGYWYIVRFEVGKDYPIYTRKKGSLQAPEQILFDVNTMAEGYAYFHFKGLNISPDNKWAIFAVDTTGRRLYSLKIKNLETNVISSECIKNTSGDSAWANDNRTFFYVQKDKQTLRCDTVKRHLLGTDSKGDVTVFYEADKAFSVDVSTSKSNQYIFIESNSTSTDEVRFLSADTPNDTFQIFQERTYGLEYSVFHYADSFYVLHNANGAYNFQIDKTPVNQTKMQYWESVVPHREQTLIEDIDIFESYLVVSEREQGLSQIRIIRWDKTQDYYIPFDNQTYMVHTSTNLDFNTTKLRMVYQSLTTPSSVQEFDMQTKQIETLKQQEVLGGFSPSDYTSERLWAIADDGKKIPISLVYKKDTPLSKDTPCLLYGYGSYGITVDSYFSTSRLSLLNRGFIFAIAHVRGGEYLGRKWYEDGKLFNKKNTFTDFISAGLHLIQQGYTSPEHLYAMGGSAGGLLMGAVINIRPDMFRAVVAQVPFVDALTTMLDDSIPLTTGEYEEWGNPNEKEYYDYIKSYSPYDNIKKQDYPNMLVTTGYHDSQVQYWEPAKWVAKLRDLKTDNNKIYFYTNMQAGHSGASGRFEALRETAQEYAFLLDFEN